MGNKHEKVLSLFTLTREIQMVKSLLETLFSATRMARMRNSIPVMETVEHLECLYATGVYCSIYQSQLHAFLITEQSNL